MLGDDPQLGALALAGSSVPVMVPVDTSPLIDLIPAADCGEAADQRGVARPSGPTCDIGAVEVDQGPPETTTPTDPATTTVPPGLPTTGSSSGPLALGGGACVALGAALLGLRRRRQFS